MNSHAYFTPLNLHSEQIGNFDYVEPKMSKHLWLYEGVTEYFANLILLQSDLITDENFLHKKIRDKISSSSRYPEKKISFTDMSQRVFEKIRSALLSGLSTRCYHWTFVGYRDHSSTNGQKTLKDVVLNYLTSMVQKDHSMKETFLMNSLPWFIQSLDSGLLIM